MICLYTRTGNVIRRANRCRDPVDFILALTCLVCRQRFTINVSIHCEKKGTAQDIPVGQTESYNYTHFNSDL